ncbi:MAG: ABC transporter permease [Actinomycetota bacterium]|nr:ABC transporter permease [Actinomycetota bacterium]
MNNLRKLLVRWELGLVVLIVIVMVVGQIADGDLLSSFNLQTTALNSVILLCLALGLAPVIMTGDIDLSVVGTLALVGVIIGDMTAHGVNTWLAIGIGLAISLLCGLINGLLVVLFDLPALAVTLGTSGAYTGVSFLILKGLAISTFPSVIVSIGSSNLTGTQIPFAVVLLLVFAVIMTFLLHGTVFGKAVFAIGGSRKAALFSGIAVNRVRILTFVISGLMAGIAGLLFLGNYQTAQAGMGASELLPAVTAVILGGVSAYGGTGTIPGVVLAAALLALLQSALGLHNFSGEGQTMAVGFLLIIAIGLPPISHKYQDWKRRRSTSPLMIANASLSGSEEGK